MATQTTTTIIMIVLLAGSVNRVVLRLLLTKRSVEGGFIFVQPFLKLLAKIQYYNCVLCVFFVAVGTIRPMTLYRMTNFT